ncbi:ATP synthase F0 subunit A [Candidatus Roizmanbacteria bacterium CG_4_10_14_0_8_um_filter_33_9]|uniref:ATP synthase subunit a n=1 Tax=Candidatus Roizmanbacteria bacterium CG_4_10_14_0_8_um_filter_33_9 TaxID=1974826 RepID=A0A2M7QJW2_9BACT|nr:MAG: ATP synthase F0 subunit A [Candidatus Roizmanbacteria bacterium CG_4_10_14_0_8_um_filter_33_9]
MPEISIKAESIFELFGFHITNSLILSLIVFLLFIIIAFVYTKDITASNKSGFFYIFNAMLQTIYGLFESILGSNTKLFFPVLSSFFVWILFQNWAGLLPGVGSILVKIEEHGRILHVPLLRGNNADINGTLALALISVIMIQVFGIKFLGLSGYLSKFFNFSNPINFFVGFLDILSEFSKILSFTFRLFGNIFAGEVLMTIIAFLIPFLAPFPFLILEIFVGVVQALVFSLLTTVFLSMAIAKHH